MKTVALNIDITTNPEKLAGDLKEHDLKKGDRLTINTLLDEQLTFLIVLVALIALYQHKLDYANNILKNIFESKDSKEIQDGIAKEYGIEVNINAQKINEDESWYRLSKEKLARAYRADEPEYDLSMVKEP